MRTIRNAKKGLAVCFLTCGLVIFAHAQESTLSLKNGKAMVKKTFQPTKQSDAHFYFLKLRKGQAVEIKVDSNEVYLTEENGCSMYFELFNAKGKAVYIGEDPVGINSWEGKIEETGNYKIKVAMSCIEAFSAKDVRKKKPTFKYALEVQMK